MTAIRPITREELNQLTDAAEVLEQDSHGIKVLRLADGTFLKYFRRKRWFNSELLAPAAVKFARHANRLQTLGIPSMKVLQLQRVQGEPHTIAIYEPLPGDTLRDLLASGHADRELCYRVGVFIARLHRLGVLFRSLHPGNIIVNDGRLGLIDVLDMQFHSGSLWRWTRRRNWLHFLRCEVDQPWLKPELIDELLLGYADAADLPASELEHVGSHVRTLLGHSPS